MTDEKKEKAFVISVPILPTDEEHEKRIDKIIADKEEKFDLYGAKRKILKQKRVLRAEILKVDSVDGGTMQRFYGESTKTRRALKIQFFGSQSKSSKYGDETSIETKFEELLTRNNIAFIKQRAIRFINTDFFLPDYNLAVETNGGYWHSDPKLYPEPKNNIQRKNIEKDKISKEIILGQGIHRLIVWESELQNEETISNLEKKFLKFLTTLTDKEAVSEDSNNWL